MEAEAFERVYQAFQEFHAYFAGAFGRKQWREHSRHYLQGLLVQAQERRNAENLSEMVPVSARAMQRFLTEARWDDDAVIARLQRVDSGRGQNRTLRSLSAFWPPVFAGEQDVGPPKG